MATIIPIQRNSFETDQNGNIRFNCICGKTLSTMSIHNHLHSVSHNEYLANLENESVGSDDIGEIGGNALTINLNEFPNYKLSMNRNILKVYFN